MKESTIDNLYTSMNPATNGKFRIGPLPDETHQCGHRWGNHIVAAKHANPLDGGTFRCNDSDCGCSGTWDVPMESGVRKKIESAMEEKRRVEEVAARRDL